MKSSFRSDLSKEQSLHSLLDGHYARMKNYQYNRIHDMQQQLNGVDLFFTHKTTREKYAVDEKAQLDYINEDLPTFAFEIHYLKDGQLKTGWFFDPKKKTDFYALATAIYSDEVGKYTSCKVTLVNRHKLIQKLDGKKLNQQRLTKCYRESKVEHGKIQLQELDPTSQGYLYKSLKNKAEKPLNLILKLDWLIKERVAKRM